MQFKILEDYEKQNRNPPQAEPEENLGSEPEETPAAEPQKKISYERIVGIINTLGSKIADDPKLSVEEKTEQWIDTLKWVYPHIPNDKQHFKASVQESIKNPCQWDFMEKPKQRNSHL